MPRFITVALLCLVLVPVSGCGGSSPEDALREAEALLAEGDPRSAMIELKNTLQENPDSGLARARLGDVHVMVGDYPSALKEYERALDLGVDTESLKISLLKTKNRLGRFAEVVGELEDRPDLTPETAVLLGEALLAAGDLERAEPFLRQGSELAAGAIGLAQIAVRRGDRDTALAESARAFELADAGTETVLTKGEIELGYTLFDDAIKTFEKALDMPAGRFPARLGMARARLGKNDLDGALNEVDTVLREAPGILPGHYLRAAILAQKDNLDGAEEAIREVQKVAPDHAPSLYLMALIKQRQGQSAQAQDQVRRFLARQPNDIQGLKLLAGMLAEENKFDQVVELLAPAVEEEAPADPQLLSMLGTAQLRVGQANEATATLQRAVEADPNAAPVRNQLALSLVAGGDASAAENLLLDALDGGDKQIENEYLLAMLRLQKRDVPGAREVIDRLMSSSPELPLPYHLRALLGIVEQNIEAAESNFRLALTKDAGFLPAAQGLAQLALQRDDMKAAKSIMAQVLEKTPDDAAALVANAELASRDGDLKSTEAFLIRAAEKNPKSVPPRIILARLYFAQGRVDEGQGMLADGLSIAPTQTDLLIIKAEQALAKNDRDVAADAADTLQGQLSEEPDNLALIGAVGTIQLRLGRIADAKVNLGRALELSDGKSSAALANLVQVHLAERDAPAARLRFDQLTGLGAKGPEVDLIAAEVLRAEGKQDAAFKIYAELIAGGSRDAVVRQYSAYLESGQRENAQATLESWLKDHPDDFALKFNLADLYISSNPDRAITLYETMVESNNLVVLNNLAWLYQQKGHPKALETARLALAAAPDNPDVLDTLGWTLIQTGAAEEGVMHLRRGLQLKPNDATLLYHLGAGLARMGSEGEARITLERALAIGEFPDRKAAETELDALSE